MNIALIIAGGKGVRMGYSIPKQFIEINDKPIIVYTLEKFENHPSIDVIAVVCIDGWVDVLNQYAKKYGISKLKHIIIGGSVGQDSIKKGLLELHKYYDDQAIVLIHDAIRPMVSSEIISNCIAQTSRCGNAITVIPCQEAMLVTDDSLSSKEAYPRSNLKRTQTPQGFRLGDILNVHEKAKKMGITDSIASCTLYTEVGRTVYFSAGSERNIKLTTPEDLEIFKNYLKLFSKK